MANLFKFAENILNNLDQSTQSSIQTALNKQSPQNEDKTTRIKSKSNSINNYQKHLEQDHMNIGSNSQVLLNSQSSNNLKSNTTQSFVNNYKSLSSNNSSSNLASNSWHSKINQEDELISFLNNNDLPNLSELTLKNNLKEKSEIGQQKSYEETNMTSINNKDVQFIIGDNKSKHSETEDDSSSEIFLEENKRAKSTSDDNENAMLKKEIKSLNQEIQSHLTRIKNIQEEFQRSKRKADQFQSQISESDKIIRELRAREEDMNESIRSKDTQLAVLRVRFEDMDNEIKSKKQEIEILRTESERILKDHTNSSDLQSQVLDTLKGKLNELENNLMREKDAFNHAQKEHMAIQSKLEAEKQSLVESLHCLEKKLNEEKVKNNELTSNLKNSKTAHNFLKQEFEEYKTKATKTLQAKDRLITTLKESSNFSNDTNDSSLNTTGVNLKSIEIDELILERDSLKEELNSKNVIIETLRSEVMEQESQSSIEIEILKDQMRNLQESLDESKQNKDYLEQDLKNLRQQLDYSQEELYKQKTNVNNKLQEREAEIEKLRTQLTTKSLSSTTEKELENRLHLLTENLIQKQTLIEALQSEKHSIFLQLERSEKRLQDYENIVASKKTSTYIRMHEDEETTNKIPYLRESPYDHEVTRKMKRAASEIDKFSIRLGVFLKKYPIARIFVIFYMILLHLWVVIVLFTYKPEVHDLTFNSPGGLPNQPNDMH